MSAPRAYRNRSGIRAQYATPGNAFFERNQTEAALTPIRSAAADDWPSSTLGPWRVLHAPGAVLPAQGWKIHVSARPHERDDVLRLVASVCVERGTSFKHLATVGDYWRAMSKYADRAAAGKFITIFPRDDVDFIDLLQTLEGTLSGYEGPYILSDVRFGKAPVFFRYGAFFLDRLETAEGVSKYAITDPAGRKMEDTRSAVFVLPDFVTPPPLIRDAVRSRLEPDDDELRQLLAPYTVRSSLHFSNAGGVYLADAPAPDLQVVLKEARRWTAYSSTTTDATRRLRDEHRALRALAGVPAVVNALDLRVLGEHEYLVEEFVAGDTLQTWTASNYPFSTDPARLASYARTALSIAEQIVTAVKDIHAAGWAVLDLQPKNILVDVNENVRLIDMEAARRLDESAEGSVGTPGFVPHMRSSNEDRDRFALAATVLHLFWPSTAAAFDPAVIRYRYTKVAQHFPPEVVDLLVPLVEAIPDAVLATSHGYRQATAEDLRAGEVVARLCAGVESSRRESSEDDRRFPGDGTQFADGPGALLNVETGAAGVILMLARAGRDVRADLEWLSDRVVRTEQVPFHGLLRGKVGIASVLAQIGLPEVAELIVLGADDPDPGRDMSLRTGLAGTIMALCEIVERTGSIAVRAELDRTAELLAVHLADDGAIVSPQAETGNAVGLFDGWAGVGLACRRLAEFTGEDRWDDAMRGAFDREIAHLVEAEDGTLRVDYSGVTYGYLSEGAAGIAFALARCAPVTYRGAIDALTRSFDGIISLNGGLFRGTSGIAAALLPADHARLASERRRLIHFTEESFLFRRPGEESLMLLGDNGHHLSADYSTGAAGFIGVLMAEHHSDPSRWFPVRLPSPLDDHEGGGEHNERIAFPAGAGR